MNLILPHIEIIEQEPGINGLYKAIELPGRICYNSLDKIKPGSAKPFIDNVLIKSKHYGPLEHGTVYLSIPTKYNKHWDKYNTNEYSKCVLYEINGEEMVAITTNYRVLVENDWLDDMEFFCEPTKYHKKRLTVKFTIDRFTGESFLRHRKFSFNRESTRFVNYTKEKFGNGSIKYIIPPWLENNLEEPNELKEYCRLIAINNDKNKFKALDYWYFALLSTEYSYNNLINTCGWTPEQARVVLCCAISSPLIQTGYIDDWKYFLDLRYFGKTGKPHPQAYQIAKQLYDKMKEL